METATIVGSFHCTLGTSNLCNGISIFQLSLTERRSFSSIMNLNHFLAMSVKVSATSHSGSGNASTQLSKRAFQPSKFPDGFEKLVHDVCDGTDIAEVKVKVGKFEMNLKRSVEVPKVAAPIISPTTAPPIPSEPMGESSLESPSTQKSLPAVTNHLKNFSTVKDLKLATLEASGEKSYVYVSSPTVGSFRHGRTINGKKKPRNCKEGDLIKEGHIIGYLDQFGRELPVRSDVAGEVVKFLYRDGEAVGFGDPLIAVLPSFKGINK